MKRYWKQNSDGSHVICLDSTSHEDCPLVLDHIRVDIHAAYVITPPKGADQEEDHCECLITAIAQVEPRGWLWKEFNFQHNFVKQVRAFE